MGKERGGGRGGGGREKERGRGREGGREGGKNEQTNDVLHRHTCVDQMKMLSAFLCGSSSEMGPGAEPEDCCFARLAG